MTKARCYVCGDYCEGKGFYPFRYLDNEYALCGHHAQKVENHIKWLRVDENDLSKKAQTNVRKFVGLTE
jgi:hypothetical protein